MTINYKSQNTYWVYQFDELSSNGSPLYYAMSMEDGEDVTEDIIEAYISYADDKPTKKFNTEYGYGGDWVKVVETTTIHSLVEG